MLDQLWNDDQGGVSAGSFLFLVVIIAIGSVVGLQIIRDHIVQEYADVAVALEELNQSYAYIISINNVPIVSVVHIEDGSSLNDPPNAPAACIEFVEPIPGEGGF